MSNSHSARHVGLATTSKTVSPAKLTQPHGQTVFGDFQGLHLRPRSFGERDQAVAFQGKQKSPLMVSDPLEIIHTIVKEIKNSATNQN
jgi:hypothetical protein